MGCTAKGLHCGTGGRIAKFVVAILYGKGVILCEEYDEMNGNYFKGLVEGEFKRMFKDSSKGGSKVFIQDGDPSQNSSLARAAWKRIGDINCIENIFHIVKTIVRNNVLRMNITYKTFEQFCERVAETIKSLDKGLIDKTIESMNHRMDLIIASKGQRTKY
ncbi:uncharacterized protein LOC144648463 [Oculina patagonica]